MKTIRASKGQAQLKVNRGYLQIRLPRHLYDGKQKCISLGLADTLENRVIANNKLVLIQKDIDYDNFDSTLEKYFGKLEENNADIIEQPRLCDLTLQEMLDQFENKYFRKRKRSKRSERTFTQHKSIIFRVFKYKNKLDFFLSQDIIEKAIYLTKPSSASRTKSIDTLKMFFKTFNVKYQFDKNLSSGYKPQEKILPSDNEIIEFWHKFKADEYPNMTGPRAGNGESWGWIYGVIATYGVRPHEILAIDYKKSFKSPYFPLYIDEKIIDGTKTGSRIVYPLPLEWVELFDIAKPKTEYIEKNRSKFLKDIKRFADRFGERIGNKDEQIKFGACHMRHRYAVRGHEFGFAIDIVAKWMGHTLEVHEKTYLKYMSEDTHVLVFKSGLNRQYEIEKVKQGKPSYKELEAKLEQAKLRKAQLQTELDLISTYKKSPQ